jgi:hypothetical protein
MDLADGIRRIGYRRWYERQLIVCHLYLIAGVLSMLAVLGGIEAFSAQAPAWMRLALIALIVGGGIACFFSLVRYKDMLASAQRAADHSTCANCAAYGALEVVRSGVTHDDAGPVPRPVPWVRVRCRKCGNEWPIEYIGRTEKR